MNTGHHRLAPARRHALPAFAAAALAVATLGTPLASAQSFNASNLAAPVLFPTALQFGPDDRLYVAQQDGAIRAFTVQRNAPGDYAITATELIDQIKSGTPNHNDDGSACSVSECAARQVTGILVTGTASNPVLYVTSSDPRISVAEDSGLDTNSGIISRLTCSGGIAGGSCQQWQRVDIVRGLPRSEENHSTNGLSLDPASNTLYVASGGNTNKGAIGSSFSGTPEYYLSGAILSVDLDAIAAIEAGNGGPFTDPRSGIAFVYDLLTLDDPTRANIGNSHPDFPYPAGHPYHGKLVDPGDPFGGNNGLNQAIPEPGGPVQVHSPGYRNPYDVLVSASGALWTWDNGPNSGWGGTPVVYAASGTRKGYVGEPGVSFDPGAGDYCSNELNEWGSGDEGDTLVLISGSGFYGGHPAPTRAFPNLSGLFNYVEQAGGGWLQQGPVYTLEQLLPAGFGLDIADFPNDPRQCNYSRLAAGLEVVSASTNGLAEYTASNFGGAMQGDLLAASFNGNIYRCKPDGSGGLVDLPGSTAGTGIGKCEVLLGGFGSQPLDVTAQGEDGIFAGTIWAATYGESSIVVFEPTDFGSCDPSDPAGDSDGDGYSNGDEADNGTNPCSGGSKPTDFDGDFVSDLNDGDDDADGIADVSDPFALDADNGLATAPPLHYPLFNNDPGTGLFGLGFTGLMLPRDGSTTWRELFDPERLAAGGAAGLLTVEEVGQGHALGSANTQHDAFMLGLDVDASSAPFAVRTRLLPPYFEVGGGGSTPQPDQSYGLFIGDGDQDDYIRLAIGAVAGGAGVSVVREAGGGASATSFGSDSWGGAALLSASAIDLVLAVDPQQLSAQPLLSLDGGSSWFALGAPVAVPASWLSASDGQGLAVGFIATAHDPDGPAQAFGATWDFLSVDDGAVVQPSTLVATPASLDFGAVAVGSQATLSVTVANQDGNQHILLEDATLAGHAAFSLADAPDLPLLLAPGESAAFAVAFAPASAGGKNGSLTLAMADGAELAIPLAGQGSVPAPKADLSVSISDDADPVAAGATLVYSVTVANHGPDTATDVVASSNLSPLVHEPSTVGCAGDPIGVPTCVLGDIAAGGELVWLISVDVDEGAAGEIAVSEVTASSSVEDPDGSDNTGSESTGIVQGAPSDVADLSVFKTAQAQYGPGGGSVSYTIVVANAGPGPVQGAMLVDLLPAELEDAQWRCVPNDAGAACAASGSGSLDEPVDLPPQTAVTFTVDALFSDPEGDGFVNTAMVTVPQGITDPDPTDNESSAIVGAIVFANGFESN